MSIYLATEGALRKAKDNKEYSGIACTAEMYNELFKKFPHSGITLSDVKDLDSNIAKLTMAFYNDLNLIQLSAEGTASMGSVQEPTDVEDQAVLTLRLKALCNNYAANIKEI